MEAAEALADLVEISSEVEAAALHAPGGGVLASVGTSDQRAVGLARAAADLLAAAATLRAGGPAVERVEASFASGGLFVLRDGDAVVAATTTPSPTSALVFYDLSVCLRAARPEGGK